MLSKFTLDLFGQGSMARSDKDFYFGNILSSTRAGSSTRQLRRAPKAPKWKKDRKIGL